MTSLPQAFLGRFRRLRAFMAASLRKSAGSNTTRRRFRVPADVPILWTDHAAPRNLLPGVRQVAQASLARCGASSRSGILELGGTMECAANEQSCSALRIGNRQTHESGNPGNSWWKRSTDSELLGGADNSQRRTNMLWTIFVVLGILWLLGFSLHIGGGLIHLLLVVALVVLVINLLSGRRGLA